MSSLVRNTVRRTARSTFRGVAAAAGIAGGGLALNAVALMVIAGGASAAGRGLLAGSGILLAGGVVAFGFVLAYLFLARMYGIRVALRTWYDAHREQALAALEAASRRADVATPTRVRNISRNVGARTSGALRAMPRPARLIATWALKRVGAGSLGTLPGGGRRRRRRLTRAAGRLHPGRAPVAESQAAGAPCRRQPCRRGGGIPLGVVKDGRGRVARRRARATIPPGARRTRRGPVPTPRTDANRRLQHQGLRPALPG
jgi:hypothetical protein